MQNSDRPNSHIIQNKYRIESILTKGSFGIIFKGSQIKTQKKVAIKMEAGHIQSLRHETRVIQFLYKKGVRKIPDILWYGTFKEKPCLVMRFYDHSLAEIVGKIHQSPPTEPEGQNRLYMILYKILQQILDIMRHVHICRVVHRDIKPQNFMFHGGEIYLIDFGMAAFLQGQTGMGTGTTLVGTPKFASIHIHRGQPYRPIDDIISIGYMILWLELGGNSPWEPESFSTDIDTLNIASPFNQQLLKNKENIATFCRDPFIARFICDHSQKYGAVINYDFVT